jgi:ATP-dependent DNA helicase 2 subunit 2
MFEHVRELVKTSLADVNYPRVCEILGVVRTELRELEVPDIYNNLIRGLKEDVGAGKLDGDRKDLWGVLRKSKLGPISGDEEGGDPAVTEKVIAEVSLLDTEAIVD